LRRIRIKFDPADRNILIEAFRKRSPIGVEGELVAEGNRLGLQNPRGLAVVPEADETLS